MYDKSTLPCKYACEGSYSSRPVLPQFLPKKLYFPGGSRKPTSFVGISGPLGLRPKTISGYDGKRFGPWTFRLKSMSINGDCP